MHGLPRNERGGALRWSRMQPMARKKISTTVYITPEQNERLKLLHDQRSRGVLRQRLIDHQADLAAGGHLTVGQVCGDELVRDASSHRRYLLRVCAEVWPGRRAARPCC